MFTLRGDDIPMTKKSYEESGPGCCPEKPRDGVTVCPLCHHRIEKLTSLRCPRCNSPLFKMGCDGNCKKCGV
jgi:uncharacterized paraquat-inducible protein A